MALIPFGKESTFGDEMSLGDDDWVDTALSGSRDFVNELLEIGEESLEFSAAEDELRKLQSKLNDAEIRESQLKQELKVKDKTISRFEDALDQLKKELLEERARARDEAEDMAQELAELRYQMSEALEEERMLRARTEQVSVHRVEELEHQVKLAREEAVVALARRREAEIQAEKGIRELRGELETTRLQLEDAQKVNQQPLCEKCPVYLDEAERLKAEVTELTIKLQQQEEEALVLREKLQRSIEYQKFSERPEEVQLAKVQDAAEITSCEREDSPEPINCGEQAQTVEMTTGETEPISGDPSLVIGEQQKETGLSTREQQEEILASVLSTEEQQLEELAGDFGAEELPFSGSQAAEAQEGSSADQEESSRAGAQEQSSGARAADQEKSMEMTSETLEDPNLVSGEQEENLAADNGADESAGEQATGKVTEEHQEQEETKAEDTGAEESTAVDMRTEQEEEQVEASEGDPRTEAQKEESVPGDSEVEKAPEDSPEEQKHEENESGLAAEDSASEVEESSPEERSELTTSPGDLFQAHNREFYSTRIESLERKISQVQDSEVQLELERSDLLLEVAELKKQVERFRLELEGSVDRHSEALMNLNKERTLLQEETEATKAALSGEIAQLQQALEGRGIENESVRRELAAYHCSLKKENDRALELAARIKALEAELESERVLYSEAASKCVDLSLSLDKTTQKLLTVEAELEVSRSESEALQKALETTEKQLLESTREKHLVEEDLQRLRGQLQAQEQRGSRLQQELACHKSSNNQLANKVGELNSEVLMLQQRLITCQTQVSELAMKNVILEDTVAAKKRKIKEGEQRMIQQAEKLGRQEERYFGLQAKFSALQNDFSALEAKLSETRRREQELRIHMERVSLELSMAKQEVVNSEVRLQKAVKHAKEQLEAENARHQELVNKHRQTEWFLNRKIEHLERSELEKEQLQQEIWRLRSENV